MIATEALAALFVEVSDTLVVDFDMVDFLQMVTARTVGLTRADAAGLVLADEHHRLQFLAASTESAKTLKLFQLQSQEGPCRDGFRSGRLVIHTNLARATARWPRFAPEAVSAGYLAVHAFPLRHRDTVIGALNLFGAAAGEIETQDLASIEALGMWPPSACCSSGHSEAARRWPGSCRSPWTRGSRSSRRRGPRPDGWRIGGRGLHPDAHPRPQKPAAADRRGPSRRGRPRQPPPAHPLATAIVPMWRN
jgi:hypothetical protein